LTVNHPELVEAPAGATPESLKAHLVYELCQAAGLQADSLQGRVLAVALRRPIRAVAQLFSDFDATVGRDGIAAGLASLVSHFVKDPQINGACNLPAQGPLVVASNHPGAYDWLLIGAILDRRDLRIVTSTVPFFHAMPNFNRQTIEVGSTREDRSRAVQEGVRHLQDGGALLIFPSGLPDPDPDVLPGAHEALATWRPGVAALVNRAPSSLVVETIVSGVVSPRWMNNRLLRLQRIDWQRRKLAEMLQVIQQIVFPRTEKLSPRLTFAPAVSGEALQCEAGAGDLLPLLIERSQALLAQHMAAAP
jgi:hypothetical protein